MNYSQIISGMLETLWWLIPVALTALLFRSAWVKGMVGEALVKLAARLRLPADTYHRIDDVTVPTPNGTTQIDHVLVSRFGIFVVETKNMKGWIFGSARQPQWTQKIYRKSFKFQNPLRQNYRHVKALEAALDVPPESIHSVVVFAGSSAFKTSMPANVTHGGHYIRFIKSFREPVLSETEVKTAIARIQDLRLLPSRTTNREHVRQLRNRFESTAKKP